MLTLTIEEYNLPDSGTPLFWVTDLATDPDGDELFFANADALPDTGQIFEVLNEPTAKIIYPLYGLEYSSIHSGHVDYTYFVQVTDGTIVITTSISIEIIQHDPNISWAGGATPDTFNSTFTEGENAANDYYLIDLTLLAFTDEQDTDLGVADLTASAYNPNWTLQWLQPDPNDATTRTHLRIEDTEDVGNGYVQLTLTDSDGHTRGFFLNLYNDPA